VYAQDLETTIAETSAGKVRGVVVEGTKVFKGIPYAASTSGKNRFMPPSKPAAWTGTRDALAFGPTAPQGGDNLGGIGAYPLPDLEDMQLLAMAERDDRRLGVIVKNLVGRFVGTAPGWPAKPDLEPVDDAKDSLPRLLLDIR